MSKRTWFVVFLLAAVTPLVRATTIVMPSDEQLVRKSPLIVVGQVVASGPVERDGRIWTATTLEVERVLRGEIPATTVVIREVGGALGHRRTVIFGAPEYRAGERVLAFLAPTRRGDYQTVDLFVGKFTERRTLDGRTLWHRAGEVAGTRLLDGELRPIALGSASREAVAFERWVRLIARGERPAPDYLIASPRLLPILPNFTLIAEPTIYRWFAFQASAVGWKSAGQQTGYNSGGVTELQTAMTAWSGFSSANIRYSYTGTVQGTPGGLNRPNGVNEVVFNDSLNEVQGSWNGSEGVVGVGGFNAVSSGGSWTGPFNADGSHQAIPYNAWNIEEGNLVIQDGVSPSRGISAYTLSEIISHEFGHTLGFGHSDDQTALMYFQITGGGPTLKADDQVAAKWLYPRIGNGGGETIPPAPSSLTASAAGNSIQLAWTDNASNEARQTIYMAVGSGAFSRYADVGTNLEAFAVNNLASGHTYRFRVTASNSAGESAASNVAEVQLQGDTPVAAFGVTPSNGTANVTSFSFVDRSTGPISSWNWSFGDNGTSNAQNPTHTYSSPGTYTVRLTVASSGGSQSTASRTIFVTAPDVPPTAAFSYAPTSPSVLDTISFVDETTGYATEWSWDFGDQTSSTEQNPSKRFDTPGDYPVKLTVKGNGLTSVAQKTVTVTSGSGGSPTVTAEFDFSPANPTTDQTVTFTDRSSGTPNAWYWDFGDRFISTQQHPPHRFAHPGTFTVTLNAGNAQSSSTISKTITVREPQGTFTAIVPVAAETTGGGGSSWRTELSIFNPSDNYADVTVRFLSQVGALPPSGQPAPKSFVIQARDTATFTNALRDLFGVTAGSAALLIEGTSPFETPALRISSRTFTTSPEGTYGQFVPGTIAGAGPRTFYLSGLAADPAYRTNVGFVNTSTSDSSVDLLLYSSDGTLAASSSLLLPKQSLQQQALKSLFPNLGETSGMTLRVNAATTFVRAYASVVDNTSLDPVFISAATATAGNQMVLPVVAKVPGAGSTFWRSDVTFFNPLSAPFSLSLRMLAANEDNVSVPSRSIIIPALQTLTVQDIVSWIEASASSGSLEISWSAPSGPVVTSRTYTTRVSDGGTFGQYIGSIGSTRFAKQQFVTGLRSDGAFRSNIGIVNNSTSAATASLNLLKNDGTVYATTEVSLKPKSQTQLGLSTLFAGKDVSALGSFTVGLESAVELFLYGSVVDNTSGDPIFVGGE